MTNPNINFNVPKGLNMTSQMMPVPDEYINAYNRHGSVKKEPTIKKRGLRRGLKKQNFIEDGQRVVNALQDLAAITPFQQQSGAGRKSTIATNDDWVRQFNSEYKNPDDSILNISSL